MVALSTGASWLVDRESHKRLRRTQKAGLEGRIQQAVLTGVPLSLRGSRGEAAALNPVCLTNLGISLKEPSS